MEFLSILLIALGLSADCFAVALSGSIAMKTVTRLKVLRISFAFGLFQFIMALLGWLAGRTIVELVSAYDHWVAFALLVIVGGRMIWESRRKEEEHTRSTDITRGIVLLTLSVATSIDSLAVGLSLAFIKIDIVIAGSIIGIAAFILTSAGFLLGRKVSALAGERAELAGGIILIAIGLRILITHTLENGS